MAPKAPQQTSAKGFAMRRVPARSRKPLVLRSLAMLLVVGLSVTGAWWLRTSSTFAVDRVESGSYRFTSQDQLQEIFGSFLGRNIWTVSSRDLADSLAVLPWVRDLKVRRRLPGSLEVDFREWRPLLVLEPGSGNQLGVGGPLVLVEGGRVLEFPDHLVLPGLPVLVAVGCGPDTLTGGLCLDQMHRESVLELVAAVEESGLESACPIDFIVARTEGFAIVLQDGRGTLLVGREDFSGRLDRYMTARDHLEPGLQMDLRFAERITCRRI